VLVLPPMHHDQRGPDVYFAAALLAVPFAAIAVAGTALTDTGLQVVGTITAGVVVAALAFVWRAIRTANKADTQAIVREENARQLAPILERLDRFEHTLVALDDAARRRDDDRHGR
jgi:membrane protein implicated in regulation of membrane protease activity